MFRIHSCPTRQKNKWLVRPSQMLHTAPTLVFHQAPHPCRANAPHLHQRPAEVPFNSLQEGYAYTESHVPSDIASA